jgi:four helix bundle protein
MTEELGYKKLRTWQKADDLACAVFAEMSRPPEKPRWLVSQVSRAAVSVAANIAEGNSRGSLGDYLRFLDIALGSLGEVEYYLHFLRRNALLTAQAADQLDALRSETGGLLVGLYRALRAKAKENSWNRDRAIREDVATYELHMDL